MAIVRQMRDMVTRDRQMRDRQMRDMVTSERQMRDRQMRDRQMRDRQMRDKQMRDRQMIDKQPRDALPSYLRRIHLVLVTWATEHGHVKVDEMLQVGVG